MKKIVFTLLLFAFSFIANAQTCPPGQLNQAAKWRFLNSQCMEDSLFLTYAGTQKVAFIDANGVLTTITFAALLDSLDVPQTDSAVYATRRWVDSLVSVSSTPSGNDKNIQFNQGGSFGAATNLNYDYVNGVFYIQDFNGDTLFSVNTQTREINQFGTNVYLKNYPDSSILFIAEDGHITADSANFQYNSGTRSLYIGPWGSVPHKPSGIGVLTSGANEWTAEVFSNSENIRNILRFIRGTGSVTSPAAISGNFMLGAIQWAPITSSAVTFSQRMNFGTVNISTPTSSFMNGVYCFSKPAASFFTSTSSMAFNIYANGKATINPSSLADSTFGLTVRGTLGVFDTAVFNPTTLTGSQNSTAFRLNQTWNTTGLVTLFRINITDNASNINSMIFDYVVGSTSQLALSKGGALTARATITGGSYRIGTTFAMTSPGDGIVTLFNNAVNGFTRLNFGGVSSAFPSISRQGAVLRVLTADTSGYAGVQTGILSVNSAPNASAALTVTSTTQGFLPPVMTAAQGSAIATPAEGLMIYVTTTNGTFATKGWYGWDGAAWKKLDN